MGDRPGWGGAGPGTWRGGARAEEPERAGPGTCEGGVGVWEGGARGLEPGRAWPGVWGSGARGVRLRVALARDSWTSHPWDFFARRAP